MDEYDEYETPSYEDDDEYLLESEFLYGDGDPSNGWEVDGKDGDDF